MNQRRVVVTGMGAVTALGVGIDANWQALSQGRSGIAPIQSFDPSGFDCRIAAEVRDFKISDFVPKSYRKATKVMARDIELAVAAADQAARHAKVQTKGTAAAPDAPPSHPSPRMGCHIGAGLIAADLDELTDALSHARREDGSFDYHKWGAEGMSQLTPLWLLKYLPNMLSCHVTIIHDMQGPSNTITCGEAAGALSIGESLRVIQRAAADLCFCGGAESKLNPMAFLRQVKTGRLNTSDNESPTTAVRPFCQSATGTVIGEGGGIVVLEALDVFEQRAARDGARAWAEILGMGSSHTVNRADRNHWPDAQGKGIRLAIQAALREAGITPDQIDVIVPQALGIPRTDAPEAAALREVFGSSLQKIALIPLTAMTGNTGVASGALATAIAAKALGEQSLPASINTVTPLDGIPAKPAPARQANLRHALVCTSSFGGQNAALVLKRYE